MEKNLNEVEVSTTVDEALVDDGSAMDNYDCDTKKFGIKELGVGAAIAAAGYGLGKLAEAGVKKLKTTKFYKNQVEKHNERKAARAEKKAAKKAEKAAKKAEAELKKNASKAE